MKNIFKHFNLFLLLSIVYFNVNLSAQEPNTMWAKVHGLHSYHPSHVCSGNSVQQTTDGGYIITGILDRTAVLIKTDTNGDTLWTKTFGSGFGFRDKGYSVQQTTDGGYVFTGKINNKAGLIKTDSNGDTLWIKTFGGVGSEGRSVQQTVDGGYVFTGIIDSTAGLVKTDSNSDTLWIKTFGGSGSEGRSVHQTTDGGYIIIGNIDSTALLIKTDTNGDTLWTKALGGIGSEARSGQPTNGGYIITGKIDSSAWLIKTDTNGDTLWTRTYGGNDSEGNSVQQTTDGGYIMAGSNINYSYYGLRWVWLIRTNSIGDTLWTKICEDLNPSTYERSVGNSVQQTSDGGYIVTGMYNFGYAAAGYNAVFFIKVAPEITAIEENPSVYVNDYQLLQNYPNPFNPKTTIEFSIPKNEFVTLIIYNLLGQEVVTLVSEKLMSGSYKYTWDASGFASGVYYYKIGASEFQQVKKLILMK